MEAKAVISLRWYIIGALVLFALMGIAKAGADARLFGNAESPLWVAFGSSEWFIGGASYNQGYPWTCDFWHLMDGHLRQLLAVCVVGWTILVIPKFRESWMVVVFAFACYWVEGFTFKLFYKVLFMGEWGVWDFLGSLP